MTHAVDQSYDTRYEYEDSPIHRHPPSDYLTSEASSQQISPLSEYFPASEMASSVPDDILSDYASPHFSPVESSFTDHSFHPLGGSLDPERNSATLLYHAETVHFGNIYTQSSACYSPAQLELSLTSPSPFGTLQYPSSPSTLEHASPSISSASVQATVTVESTSPITRQHSDHDQITPTRASDHVRIQHDGDDDDVLDPPNSEVAQELAFSPMDTGDHDFSASLIKRESPSPIYASSIASSSSEEGDQLDESGSEDNDDNDSEYDPAPIVIVKRTRSFASARAARSRTTSSSSSRRGTGAYSVSADIAPLRARTAQPIPVPHLTKKSRGRKVPTGASASTSAPDLPSVLRASGRRTSRGKSKRQEKQESRPFVCDVDGCGKCFVRGEHLKRHVRSIHTHDKRQCFSSFCLANSRLIHF